MKYLEELARENGQDISSLKRIEELGREKKSLQHEVNALERQIRMLEDLHHTKKGEENDGGFDEEMF